MIASAAFPKNLLLPFAWNKPQLKLIAYADFLHKPRACQHNCSQFIPKDALRQSNHGILSSTFLNYWSDCYVFSMERTLQKYAEIGVIRLPHACSDMCKIPIVVPLDFQMKSLVLELAWNESFGIFQPVRREWNTSYIVVLFSTSLTAGFLY